MRLHHPALFAVLLVGTALAGCGEQGETPSGSAQSAAALTTNGVTATMTVDSWGAGYCANIALANTSTSAVTSWTLVVALNGSTLNNAWGGTTSVSAGALTIRPVDYNTNIAPGATATLGFCGSGSSQPALTSLEVVGGGGPGPTNPTLTVSKGGQGSGTVTSSPAGINCGTTCSAGYPAGTSVTLTAVAASGSTFAGWSGTCAGFASGVLTLNASCAVTATFNPDGAAGTTVSVNAGGAAAGSFVADASFSGGSTYTTTSAIDTSQIAGTVPPQAVFQTERYGEFTYTIANRTPGSAQTVTLYFSESYWTAAGRRTFNVAINGATVLTAFDIFAAAGGANRAVARTFDTTASTSGQVVIAFTRGGGPDNPKVCGITVSGGGAPGDIYTLSVTKTGTGTGTVTAGGTPSGGGINCGSICSATYVAGTNVTLTASAASGSTFAGWSGACSGTSTCTVSMTAARTVTATFTSQVTTYALTVTKSGTGSGTVTSNPSGVNCGSTCTASYQSGASVTLSAAAATGSTFGGWSGACTGTGSCVVSMTAARSVSASFTGSGGCTIGATRGSEVAVIGDSFIAMSHGITQEIERLARAAGSLGASDRYVDNSVSGTTLANNQIPSQYTRAVQSSGRIRYVLMDGGGNDCLINNNANAAYSAAQSLFQTMAQNNTEKVVYFFYPDPVGSNYASLKTCLDGLRPRMKALCDGLTAPRCYWLDLRPTWNGHPEYTSDGIHPTATGSVVTGAAVWQAMKTNCVAQ